MALIVTMSVLPINTMIAIIAVITELAGLTRLNGFNPILSGVSDQRLHKKKFQT